MNNIFHCITKNGKSIEVSWLPGQYFICVNNPGAFKYILLF